MYSYFNYSKKNKFILFIYPIKTGLTLILILHLKNNYMDEYNLNNCYMNYLEFTLQLYFKNIHY